MPRGGKRPGAGRKRSGTDEPKRATDPTYERQPQACTRGVVLSPVATEQHTTGDPLRDALAAAKDLTLRLVGELAAVTTRLGDIERLIGEEDNVLRRRALGQAVSLGARAEVLKTLATAARTWAELERRPADGKKGARAEAAQEAAIGKFATPQAPPRLQ